MIFIYVYIPKAFYSKTVNEESKEATKTSEKS